ncbi:MAG: family 14 glycosylhydrolase [Deltaproteobacteria bacterium]|nr:family 14 glycosylhydrolase [Deltaproteobacteria bacterium]
MRFHIVHLLLFFVGIGGAECAHSPVGELGKPEIGAMAPLLVTDPRKPGWQEDKQSWKRFKKELLQLKAMGFRAITVDVWWGIVQQNSPARFDWSYYDMVFSQIRDAGFFIVPILSVHACGTNVNDDSSVPLPSWILKLVPTLAAGRDAAYVSEAGNRSEEVISVWATEYILPYYRRFWEAFHDHFGNLSGSMPQLIVGVGPAGELVYPSYHHHDRSKNYGPTQYPNRGALQASSTLAQESLRLWLQSKYHSIDQLNRAWSTEFSNFLSVRLLALSVEVEKFFANHLQYSPMGQDFFDWYRDSLFHHGYVMGLAFSKIYQREGSPFRGARLAMKVPGIHWQFENRMAQLTSGLLSTRGASLDSSLSAFQRQPNDWNHDEGYGYRELFRQVFRKLRRAEPRVDWVGIFNCGELENEERFSRGYDLVTAIGKLASQYEMPFVLENALADSLFSQSAFDVLYSHLKNYPFFLGVTLLRQMQAVRSPLVKAFATNLPTKEFPSSCARLLLNANRNSNQR